MPDRPRMLNPGGRRFSLFAYGTLQIPEVRLALTGRVFESVPAILENYACYRLRGSVYPGLYPENGARTEGTLLLGIDSLSLRRLDRFEDDFYIRTTVSVVLPEKGRLAAEVYVVSPQYRRLFLPSLWDFNEFQRYHLAKYLRYCRAHYR